MRRFYELPETINYHFTRTCNMKCEFCFAGFKESNKFSLEKHKAIIRAIAKAPLSESSKTRRLNFVGGEPTLYPYLKDLIYEAISHDLRVSMVTNAFNLIHKEFEDYHKHMELIGLSVDSLNPILNKRIGRHVNGETLSEENLIYLCDQIKLNGIDLKINTTVSKYNANEDISAFIIKAKPLRWKVFQAMVVKGQNHSSSNNWIIDNEVFKAYVNKHISAGVNPISENEKVMRGSYAMISPDGKFFDSTRGYHKYSPPILKVGVEKAWKVIHFNKFQYDKRTSSYSSETHSARLRNNVYH